MDYLSELTHLPIFRNATIEWLIAGAVSVGVLLALFVTRAAFRRFQARLRSTQEIELIEVPVDALSRTSALLIVVVALFAGLATLEKSAATARLLDSILTVVLFTQVGGWAAAAANLLLERRRRRIAATDRAMVSSLGIIGFIVRMAIWAVIVLLVLENLGVDVTALVAGLGIGGVAIALASQNILGDLFASLSITFDRPFVIGDFLIIDDFLGAVEYIGVKSTRLRSLSGEQIILSNADLLKSRVRNYGRMLERRVVFTLNVVKETPADLIERVPQRIREIVESQKDVRFDRSHFANHGAASLDFETVYYVLSPDYNRYMDIHQAIQLAIHREFERLGIEFAYPTQKLYLARSPAPLASSAAPSAIA
jgi:small-conductance mechanosensitive channel